MPQDFQWNVVGDLVPPTVIGIEVVDGVTLILSYSEAVVASEAVDISNYDFSPALELVNVEQVSASQYRLHTALQVPGTNYTLTVTGVHDLNGNLI